MDLGMPELLFIMFVALLIFGPAQLPKLGKQLGNALGEFKRASNEFKNQLEDEVNQLEFKQLQEEAKRAISLEPLEGTVAKGSGAPEPTDFSKLSHDPAWEDPERSIIMPPTQAPAAPGKPPAAPSASSEAAPAKPAGDHVG